MVFYAKNMAKKEFDLIIKGRYILPMDKQLNIVNNGFVVVDKNKIIEVGEISELDENYKAKEIIDSGNSIVMPGLINTHTHAAMCYFRGMADDLPLDDWLNNYIWPAEAKYTNPEFISKAAELACLEMIKSGITYFNDMYLFEEAMVGIIEKSGIRACLGEVILDFPTPSCKTPKETIEKTIQLIKSLKNNELIDVAFAPHSMYACSKSVLLDVKQAACDYKKLIHIHISETKKEVDNSHKEHDKSPVEYLEELGILGENVLAPHCVWMNEKDIKIFKNNNVKVSHCPTSNMKLASGIIPIQEMINNKINVSLGTDGAASNNVLNLFFEMKTCALLHKVNRFDPTVLNAREVVKMATVNAAKALGADDRVGSLEIGKKADIITINLDKPHLMPIYDPYSHLVYCANSGDVNDVVINGKIIMRNREVKTIDEERISNEVSKFKGKNRNIKN